MRAPVTDSLTTAKPEAKPWIAAIHAYVPGKSKAAEEHGHAEASDPQERIQVAVSPHPGDRGGVVVAEDPEGGQAAHRFQQCVSRPGHCNSEVFDFAGQPSCGSASSRRTA